MRCSAVTSRKLEGRGKFARNEIESDGREEVDVPATAVEVYMAGIKDTLELPFTFQDLKCVKFAVGDSTDMILRCQSELEFDLEVITK